MDRSSRTGHRKGSSAQSRRLPVSERQLEAYLLSRETLRRIRRTAAWLGNSNKTAEQH